MRLAAVAMVKDEADIIEAFVRHNLATVDFLIVADDGSTDETSKILESLCREGLPVHVRKHTKIGRHQATCVSALMREAVEEFDADWVFLLDADEMIIGDGTRSVLDSRIDCPIGVQWRTYCPTFQDNALEKNLVQRIQRRRSIEPQASWKMVAPKALIVDEEVTAYQGSHFLMRQGQPLTWQPESRIALAHFPVRSAGQYACKVLLSAFQYAALGLARDVTWGTRCRRELERFLTDPHAFFNDWREVGATYALSPNAPEPELKHDPVVYRGDSIQFSNGDVLEDDCWRRVVRYTLHLATAYGSVPDRPSHGNLDEAARIAEWSLRSVQREVAYQTALERIDNLESALARQAAMNSPEERIRWFLSWRSKRSA